MKRGGMAVLAALAIAGCGAQADNGSTRADLRFTESDGVPLHGVAGLTQSVGPSVASPPGLPTGPEFAAVPPENGRAEQEHVDRPTAVPDDALIIEGPPATEVATSDVRSLTVDASEVADEGECRLWLDTPDSPLRVDDVSVDVDGDSWVAQTMCDDAANSWLMSRDELGTWLELCPYACVALLAQPTSQLTVRTTYWVEVSNVTTK